ncbi:MAG: type II toxin-antitoxin system VapC family toxin [Sulfuricellaceae bacterium]|nr:type II toxin-antitoxin system VapC family toxin [Sulfuricellaceae bacterium]
MRLLLDTPVFLWWVSDAPELSAKARATIRKGQNECFLSVASAWEIAIKVSTGKLALSQPVERFVPEQLAANGFRLLGIDFRHVARVETLPFHHRDPFDRLLAAQAMSEKMPVVSADAALSEYGIKRIW